MTTSPTADYISEADYQANFAEHEWLRKKATHCMHGAPPPPQNR
jgi:hypothetical protein